MRKEEVKESDTLVASGWHIARETSESVYIWDIKMAGKTEIV